MSRALFLSALVSVVILGGCTKSAPKDNGSGDPPRDVVNVPGSDVPPVTGIGMGKGRGGPEGAQTAGSDPQKLVPEEGKLAIVSPSDAKAGAETIAKITVTPAAGYHVNTEFPTKLTLDATAGVTLAKAEFKAGGMDKSKGDADVFEEQSLELGIKLTAAKSGSYTINGTFKFAVCDKDSCRPKKEAIAIQVAAK